MLSCLSVYNFYFSTSKLLEININLSMTSLLLLTVIFISLLERSSTSYHGISTFSESLTPYVFQHGSHMSHREIRDCHKNQYGSLPHELYEAHQSPNISAPFVQVKRFVKEISSSTFLKRFARGHIVIISDPLQTLSVLEPNQVGGCNLNILQTVQETSKKGNCVLALNAGYFDTKRGTCYGNVISNSAKARDAKGIQNAHFGITEDGQIFTGYLSEEEFNTVDFKQLVGGVVWILRNGSGFVNSSKTFECEDSQETGSMEEFVNIFSARSVVGHDKDGNVVIVQVDGKSSVDGINLYEMETLLKEFGLVNAINLDGGGSSTLVINGITVNYPYDICPDGSFSCDRRVSTILCVHSPYCEPKNCNNHGSCSMGECICEKNWLPPDCSKLACGQHNCSEHGVCLPEGCVCHPGFFGTDCDKACLNGWFGLSCSQQCDCVNADSCDPVSGKCICRPGFTGKRCENECSEGFYGENCQLKCHCRNSCYCDRVTGSCDVLHNSSIYTAAHCLAETIIQEQHLVKDNSAEKRKWYITVIILGIITTLCLTSFLLLLFCSCSCRCRNEQVLCSKNSRRSFSKIPLQMPSGELSDSFSDSEIYPMKTIQKS